MGFPDATTLDSLIESVDLPPMGHVRYDPPTPQTTDIETATEEALVEFAENLVPGSTVGIGVGSRGITDIVPITRTTIDWLRERDLEPRIIPAMGSHGGGTALGQRSVLSELGISADSMDCPIDASMDTTVIGMATLESTTVDVYASTAVLEADAIIPINRIAPHTSFTGSVESGICKMIVVGWGKREGARTVHRLGRTFGFDQTLAALLPTFNDVCHIPGGIGILENAYEQTAEIVPLSGPDFLDREASLLPRARKLLPTLPFEHIDLLIVDEMGKDVSGTGMDPNVTGRPGPGLSAPPGSSAIERIYVRSLTERTDGNANGIGLADAIHQDVAEDIDFTSTYANVLTSGYPSKAALPLALPTDEQAIYALIGSLGAISPEDVNLVWIRNTGDLTCFRASRSLLESCNVSTIEVEHWESIGFDEGKIVPTIIRED